MNGGSNSGWLGLCTRAFLLAAGSISAGCAGQVVETAFRSDFKCYAPIEVEESRHEGRYDARGCGREATYECSGSASQTVCSLDVEKKPETSREMVRLTEPPPLRSNPSEVQVQNNQGKSTLWLELPVGQGAVLRFSAAPDKAADVVQLKLMRSSLAKVADECQLQLMVNGQVLDLPATVVALDKLVLSHRVLVGQGIIADLQVAEKVSLRVCQDRFSLNGEQIVKVRDFMERYQEELAWKGAPREGGSAAMVAPVGGWPAWVNAGSIPAPSKGEALEATALFKKLAASVFKLEATRSQGVSQGSAVAINQTELVTNCHVVQGALKVVLKQGKQEWAAEILRADPKTDRCVIGSGNAQLVPVVGVRAFDTLEVGEKVYTLGSPRGLELTLSDGIISGRRSEQGFVFVQTTAPISPGSSGGGLFDARGNLVGVTTLVLAGSDRLNQSLNFAIPADAFWQK